MDKFHAVRAFMEVASTESFSKAARTMGVATSSVTRLVDALEASLGTALFTRTTRHVKLTDAGMTYLAQVSKVMADLEQADDSVAEDKNEPAGSLRVSVPVTFGRLCLSPCFAAYLQTYPRMTLDVVVSDAYSDLAAEHIDVAIRIGQPSADPNLIVKRLAGNERYVVATHTYLQHRKLPKRPQEIAHHECVRFAYGMRQQWTFKRAGQMVTADPVGRLTANSLDILYDAVRNGSGLALLPKWLVTDDIESSRMVRLFEDWNVSPSSEETYIYAAYLSNRRFSKKISSFIDFLQSHLSMT